MNIREFKKTDYETIKGWWRTHKWVPIPLDFLPKTGLIVDDYCSGFLYKTDSKIAILEFIISNPNTDKIKRADALDLLIDGLCVEAKNSGYDAIFSYLVHPNLIERYKKHNFIITDTDVTNFMRVL